LTDKDKNTKTAASTTSAVQPDKSLRKVMLEKAEKKEVKK
jgi:hypothetical protein